MARYLAAAIAAALMAVFVYPATALGAKPEKVEVCHIGENGPKTLTVPEKVAQNHVEKHGDSLGACATGPGPAAGCYATETGGADLDYDGNVNTPSNTKLFAGGTNCSYATTDRPAIQDARPGEQRRRGRERLQWVG